MKSNGNHNINNDIDLSEGVKSHIKENDINKLEKVLNQFEVDWERAQTLRATKWRFYFLISAAIALSLFMYSPSLWWLGLAVISYFAGSLYSLLRQNAKTSHQIVEHHQQLKLARLLSSNEIYANSKSTPP